MKNTLFFALSLISLSCPFIAGMDRVPAPSVTDLEIIASINTPVNLFHQAAEVLIKICNHKQMIFLFNKDIATYSNQPEASILVSVADQGKKAYEAKVQRATQEFNSLVNQAKEAVKSAQTILSNNSLNGINDLLKEQESTFDTVLTVMKSIEGDITFDAAEAAKKQVDAIEKERLSSFEQTLQPYRRPL